MPTSVLFACLSICGGNLKWTYLHLKVLMSLPKTSGSGKLRISELCKLCFQTVCLGMVSPGDGFEGQSTNATCSDYFRMT